MQNRRQLIKSAGAVAPALILPTSLLATNQVSAQTVEEGNQPLDDPQTLRSTPMLSEADVKALESLYPKKITHVRTNINKPGGRGIFGYKPTVNGIAVVTEYWTLERVNFVISRHTKFIQYRVTQELVDIKGNKFSTTLPNVRNRLFADRSKNDTVIYDSVGKQRNYPLGIGATAAVEANTTDSVHPPTQCESGRCLQRGLRARLFALIVPLAVYKIPPIMTVSTPTAAIATTSGLVSWYFGCKTFDAVDDLTGKKSRYQMWWAFDAIIGKWRWAIIDVLTPLGKSQMTTLQAVMNAARGYIARLYIAPLILNVTGGALIAKGIQTLGQILEDKHEREINEGWAYLSIALGLVALGGQAALVMNDYAGLRERMQTTANSIMEISQVGGLALHSGIVQVTQGNYLRDGYAAARNGDFPPIDYDDGDIEMLANLQTLGTNG